MSTLRTTWSTRWPPGRRVDDDQRHARAEVAQGGVALAPGAVLEELHAVVAVEHHDGVREAAVVQLAQQAPDLVVELGHAAIVEIEDLVEVELFARLALAADDLERFGQPGHGELGRAGIGRIGEPGVVGCSDANGGCVVE